MRKSGLLETQESAYEGGATNVISLTWENTMATRLTSFVTL